MRRFLVLIALLAAAAVPACDNEVGPEARPRSDTTPLRQGSAAPPLESYTVTFTAVKGEAKEVEVKYAPPGGSPEDFLDIEIPQDGLLRRPDGSQIENGDSVQIVVTIDPVEFVFTVEPAGLQFNPGAPMRIEVRYENADSDFDDDGDSDDDDETIRVERVAIFREDVPSFWTPLPTTHDTGGRILVATSDILENIAVSW
jgi:hypothetical protein